MARPPTENERVVPLIEEQVTIGKRKVETDRVTLRRHVEEFETQVVQPLLKHAFRVERVKLNQKVDSVPSARVEGNTTIYSIVEERLVLIKELYVIEEVHVTEGEQTIVERQTVRLKRERLDVEHAPEFIND